jgi:DNA-binding MarR family transcriptional regulator
MTTKGKRVARVKRRILQRGKTLRAFGAYLDLLDTAEMMRNELRGQLDGFGLTLRKFRLMEILYREGPTTMVIVAEKLLCSRQNLEFISKPLEERGWVRRVLRPLRAEELAERKRVRAIGHPYRRYKNGHAVGILMLTAQGTTRVMVPPSICLHGCRVYSTNERQATNRNPCQKTTESHRLLSRRYRVNGSEGYNLAKYAAGSRHETRAL